MDVVAYLLGLGVLDVAAEGFGIHSSLQRACVGKHVEVMKLLIEGGADVDVEGTNKYGLLFTACRSGKSEVVRLLVEAGSGSGTAKDGGVWANGLRRAAGRGHVDVVRLLVDTGVEVECVDGDGKTALCSASRGGRVDVVRALVGEGGADVNKAGRGGWTPLMWASLEGKEDAVRVLLELGADVGVREDEGETALDVARRTGRNGIVAVLEEWDGA